MNEERPVYMEVVINTGETASLSFRPDYPNRVGVVVDTNTMWFETTVGEYYRDRVIINIPTGSLYELHEMIGNVLEDMKKQAEGVE